MTDYYTAPNGNASWEEAQNIDTPCDLQVAAQNAIAGDTVYLRGGTYILPVQPDERWHAGFMPTNAGTTTHPITFMSYTREIPFLDNSANAGNPYVVASFGTHYQDYIVFDGLQTKVVPIVGLGRGGMLHRTTGSIIRNCDIEGVSASAGNINSVRLENASYCTINNNKLYGNHGGVPNGSGIMNYGVDHLLCYNNELYDNGTGIYDKGGSANNSYYFNFIHDNTKGFRLGTEVGVNPHDLKVYQNVFINNDLQSFDSIPDKKPVTGVLFYNNVIYGALVQLGDDANPLRGYEFFNNIFVIGTSIWFDNLSQVDVSDYNNYTTSTNFIMGNTTYTSLSSWQAATGFDLNSHTNNPNFLNPGGIYPEDYKRTSYPLDGRGGNYPSVMGAYVTGNEIIGASAFPVITPPPSEIPPMISPTVTNLTFLPSIIKDNMNWTAIITVQNHNDFPIENVQVGFFISEVPDTIIHTIEAITIPASTTIDLETTFEPWQANQYHLCAKVLGE